ncbi:MAG: thiol reductant ABC exporter subunit CydC [Anaerolineales bacterium]
MSSTARKLLTLISPYLSRMTASVALGFLTLASGVGLMSVSAYIIARAALQPPLVELQVAIAGVRAFGIARGLLRYLERLLSHDTALRILNHLRVWIYAQVESLPTSRYESYRSGDLLARLIADVNTLENLFVRALAPTAVSWITAVAMTIFMSFYAPSLAILFLLFYIVAIAFIPWLSFRWSGQVGKKLVDHRSEMFSTVLDGLQGNAELLAFHQADSHLQKISAATEKYHHLQIQAAWRSGFADALSFSLAHFSVIAIFLVAIPLIQAGSLTGIDLAVLVLANLTCYEIAFTLPAAYQELNRDLTAGDRIFDLVATEAEKPLSRSSIESRSSPPRIEFHEVSFTYPNRNQPALENVSFTIAPAEQIAIVGPSGSGKTTLTEVLLQFRQPYQGSILIDGKELHSIDPDVARRLFTVVPQKPYLFHGTLRDNLLLAKPTASDPELFKAIEQAQLRDFMERIPDGLETQVGEHGYQLSAGERQRFSIARSILRQAPVLIMDEASTHLDAETETRLWRSLSPRFEACSSLTISHRLTSLKGRSRILVLDQGRIIQQGSYEELSSHEGWFQRAVRSERAHAVIESLHAEI